MKKYTVIYTCSHQVGNHWHTIVKMKRFSLVRNQRVADALTLLKIDEPQFLFHGWPKIQGE